MAMICRLTPVHAPAYRALMLHAYALHPEAFTSSVRERAQQPLAWWEARVRDDPVAEEVVYGAFAGNDLCGVVGLRFDTREKTRHKALLFGMYVDAGHAGTGIGRSLVGAALDHARDRPDTWVVQLTVTQGNEPALRLYTACGFEAFGVEPYAVRLGDRFAAKVHMWRSLRPQPGSALADEPPPARA